MTALTIIHSVIDSPVGKIGFQCQDDVLIKVEFLPKETPLTPPQTPFAHKVADELKRYFSRQIKAFSLPIQFQGTPFQQRVWNRLQTIPFGETAQYGTLAKELQTSARAIGNACRTNPLPLVIPCHRVTARGHLGGFMGETRGEGIERKRWLLAHEQTL